MTNTSVSENVHPLQTIEHDKFTIACRQAAEIMFKPEHGERLTKAMDFVLGGNVTLHDDGACAHCQAVGCAACCGAWRPLPPACSPNRSYVRLSSWTAR